MDQYTLKVAEIYSGVLRLSKPLYSSLPELHKAFDRAIPRESEAEA